MRQNGVRSRSTSRSTSLGDTLDQIIATAWTVVAASSSLPLDIQKKEYDTVMFTLLGDYEGLANGRSLLLPVG